MTEKNKGGRPLIEIDWPKVDTMCQIQCTGEEIASVLNIDYDTLQRACKREKECSFADYLAQKAPAGKASLRRRQYKAAMEGNATMLVWLGKNMLGQVDKPADLETEEAPALEINFNVKEAKAEIKTTNAKS